MGGIGAAFVGGWIGEGFFIVGAGSANIFKVMGTGFKVCVMGVDRDKKDQSAHRMSR